MKSEAFDVVVLGAGAAGLFAAHACARRGRRVVILDHMARAGEKIRISGGGRCNFTHLETTPARFLSENPRFAASALARFTPADFLALLAAETKIAWEDRGAGQLFCQGSAQAMVDWLVGRAVGAGAVLRLSTPFGAVTHDGTGFRVETESGPLTSAALIVATGGKSIPKIGASGRGYQIAEDFGLRLVPTRPGLVPLTFGPPELPRLAALAGLALPARLSCGKTHFDGPLLFTHRGLSGPSILQISSYWREGQALIADLLPGRAAPDWLQEQRAGAGAQSLARILARALPERLAKAWAEESGLSGPFAAQSKAALAPLGAKLNAWALKPTGSEGYRTAEVTLGGVSTADLDAKTMAARQVPGLYFIGEVVDVTGWLGGYNFQWAWASAHAAGQVA